MVSRLKYKRKPKSVLTLEMPVLTEGEDWKLEDVRVNDSSKPASLASPRSDVSSEAESAKWTLVSRLTSRLAEGQPPAPPSSSGRSTPSNLERAVLLLESEKEHDRAAQASAGAPAPDQEVAGKAVSMAVAPREDEGEGTLNLTERRASLRKVATDGGDPSGDSAEEGPSTPPTGGVPTRSGSIKADTPSSSAGAQPSTVLHANAPGHSHLQHACVSRMSCGARCGAARDGPGSCWMSTFMQPVGYSLYQIYRIMPLGG